MRPDERLTARRSVSNGAGSAADDPRIAEALQEYLAELEAGRPPRREEFLARHPSVAEALGPYLEGLELMHAAAPRPGTVGAAEEPGSGTPLGDFRLIREVGRGGMGVVYEAEQLSLGRRVALKVLPFAATMDPRQLQRFHNEARAAASLHHEHIVPVHAVGCERGVHYYAMQFIDGQTLAAFLKDQARSALSNQPTAPEKRADQAAETVVAATTCAPPPSDAAHLRRVAEWGIAAAAALEHAHSLGVVHRDVKPGNLMLDGLGKLWVTDFGLARTQADANLTATGNVVGTLRYMSPEQALAKHGLVDHRTDVYSLGATLYELLTGVPAVPGEDREVILRNLTFVEPRRPRAVNKAVPADLETVVLKALAKEPADRYATAGLLADDLRSFLDHRPVRARRVSLLGRVKKWSQRHRALVNITFLLSVLAAVGLLVGMVIVLREQSRAEARLRLAREAADDMWGEFAQEWLSREPGKEEAQRRFLLKALKFYEEFARESGDEPEVRFRVAEACERVGDIHRMQSDYPQARAAYTRAIDLCKVLGDRHPERPEYRNVLGRSYMKLGFASDPDQFESARQHQQAVAVMQKLAADFPGEPKYRYSLARSLNNLGNPLFTSGQVREAEIVYRLSIATSERLLKEYPGEADYLRILAVARGSLAMVLADDGRIAEAEAAYRDAEACYARLAPDTTPSYWDKLKPYDWFNRAKDWVWQGELLALLGRAREGEDALRRAVAALQRLTADFSRVSYYSTSLGGAWHTLGDLHDHCGRAREADEAYRQEAKVWEKVLDESPQDPDGPANLARLMSQSPREPFRDPPRALELARRATELEPRRGDYWVGLGMAHFRTGDYAATIEVLNRARGLVGQNRDDDPDNWLFLAMAHWQRGDKAQAREWYDKSARRLEQRPLERYRFRHLFAEAGELLGVKDSPALPGK